jgi:hypothetical protein
MEDIGLIGEILPKRENKNKKLKNGDFEVFYLLDISTTKVKIVKYIYLIFNVQPNIQKDD